MPEPEFYVIYTGDRKTRPEEINLRQAFFNGKPVAIDITAKMIYDGRPGDIINQYVTFCHVLNEQYRKFGRTAEAVREAIRICKDRDVLKKYLEEREKEVMDIMRVLYDQETAMENYVAEAVREAVTETTVKVDREARADERLTVNLGAIRNLMETLKLSPAEAMNAMKIPADQQAIYAAQL